MDEDKFKNLRLIKIFDEESQKDITVVPFDNIFSILELQRKEINLMHQEEIHKLLENQMKSEMFGGKI